MQTPEAIVLIGHSTLTILGFLLFYLEKRKRRIVEGHYKKAFEKLHLKIGEEVSQITIIAEEALKIEAYSLLLNLKETKIRLNDERHFLYLFSIPEDIECINILNYFEERESFTKKNQDLFKLILIKLKHKKGKEWQIVRNKIIKFLDVSEQQYYIPKKNQISVLLNFIRVNNKIF